uniref:Uncharacterized protein n=1 Tax=Rhizophora mucronata TaxID=61149 RepID=A0A2P2JD90_RHIMU
MRWLGLGGGGGGGGANIGIGIRNIKNTAVRYFSRKRAENLRKINPKVPFPEAASIAQSLYHIIKEHGPLSIANTWNYAKEADINGLNSKTHMKLMLKWMRGRKVLKLLCSHVGSSKKFLYSILPDELQTDKSKGPAELKLHTEKRPIKQKNQHN